MKRFLTILLTLTVLFPASGQSWPEKATVSADGVFRTNSLKQSFAGLDLGASIPIGEYFTAEAAAEILIPGIYAVSATARPGFTVGGGRFFLDGSILHRSLKEYETSQLAGALSAGYKRQYFSIQFGAYAMKVYDRSEARDNLSATIDFLYRGSACIKSSESKWNLGVAVSNYTPYEIEHMWSPIFFLFGHFDLSDRVSLQGELEFRHIGMLSMQGGIYAFGAHAGVSYYFGKKQ